MDKNYDGVVLHKDYDGVVLHLENIIEEFNKNFAKWTSEHGCVAEMGWKYLPDTGTKQLKINSVDKIIFRTPAPDADTFRKVMEKYAPDKPTV